jgi:hypothetical protein
MTIPNWNRLKWHLGHTGASMGVTLALFCLGHTTIELDILGAMLVGAGAMPLFLEIAFPSGLMDAITDLNQYCTLPWAFYAAYQGDWWIFGFLFAFGIMFYFLTLKYAKP